MHHGGGPPKMGVEFAKIMDDRVVYFFKIDFLCLTLKGLENHIMVAMPCLTVFEHDSDLIAGKH
jgi:hypothetical protein